MAVAVDIIIINQSKFQKLLLRLLSEVNRLKLQTKMRTGNYFVLLGFHGKFLLLGRLRKLSEIFSLLTIEIIFTYFHLRLHLAFLQSQNGNGENKLSRCFRFFRFRFQVQVKIFSLFLLVGHQIICFSFIFHPTIDNVCIRILRFKGC